MNVWSNPEFSGWQMGWFSLFGLLIEGGTLGWAKRKSTTSFVKFLERFGTWLAPEILQN
jgi:hypothetical protein